MRFCVFSSNFSVVWFCLAGFHSICFSSTSVPVRIYPCLFCYFNSSTFFRIRTLLWASSIRFSTVFNSYLLSAISYSSWPTFCSCSSLVARSSFDWTRDTTCSRFFNYSREDNVLGLRRLFWYLPCHGPPRGMTSLSLGAWRACFQTDCAN